MSTSKRLELNLIYW